MEQSQELQSRIINFLRFPLIVGVVFLHNYALSTDTIVRTEFSIYNYSSEIVSQVLTRVSVPLFFIISGLLFFYKTEFDARTYLRKLKSRSRSLVIPYLFWNALVFVLYYLITFHTNIVLGNNYVELNWKYFVNCFIGNSQPISYQFWFIKDLIILVLISPIIYIYVRYTKLFGVILLWIIWVFALNIPYIGNVIGISSIFFFSLGAWFGIYKENLVCSCFKVRYVGYLYPLIAVLDVLSNGQVYHAFVHKIGIMLAIVFWINLLKWLFEKQKISDTPFLASASFFVFAIHDPWLLTVINKAIYKSGFIGNDITYTLQYYGVAIIVVLVALSIYSVLRKYLPRFTAFITGGR